MEFYTNLVYFVERSEFNAERWRMRESVRAEAVIKINAK